MGRKNGRDDSGWTCTNICTHKHTHSAFALTRTRMAEWLVPAWRQKPGWSDEFPRSPAVTAPDECGNGTRICLSAFPGESSGEGFAEASVSHIFTWPEILQSYPATLIYQISTMCPSTMPCSRGSVGHGSYSSVLLVSSMNTIRCSLEAFWIHLSARLSLQNKSRPWSLLLKGSSTLL